MEETITKARNTLLLIKKTSDWAMIISGLGLVATVLSGLILGKMLLIVIGLIICVVTFLFIAVIESILLKLLDLILNQTNLTIEDLKIKE